MSPLAARLLRLILGLYLGIAMLTTGLQLYAEYTNERETMSAGVSESVELVMPALIAGLRDIDKQVLGDTIKSLSKIKTITGLHLIGDIEVREGRVDNTDSTSWIDQSFKQSYAIEDVSIDGERKVLGFLYAYSQVEALTARTKSGFISALSAAIVNTAFLGLILYFVIKSVVVAPLLKLSQRINKASCGPDVGKRATPSGGTASNRTDEVTSLFRAFLSMRRDFGKSRAIFQEQRDRLIARAEEAEATSNAKSDFLTNISHELRTPMHAILSFSEIGDRKVANAGTTEGRKYFQKISTSGARLMTILNDLLDLSKLESTNSGIDLRENSVNRIVEMSIEEMASLASQRDIQLRFKTSPGNDCCLLDVSHCLQVMRNLISNAIKFSPTGSAVDIEVTRYLDMQHDQNSLYITVEDRGIGIPDDEIELVFDKFVQSSKTKSNTDGTGLGLAICREIINHHGGKIWAEPNRETGSRFVIRFQLAQIASKAA